MGRMYSQSTTILKHIKLTWAVMPQIVCFSIAMQRWQRGPMHGIANPENRVFKSRPLLQERSV